MAFTPRQIEQFVTEKGTRDSQKSPDLAKL